MAMQIKLFAVVFVVVVSRGDVRCACFKQVHYSEQRQISYYAIILTFKLNTDNVSILIMFCGSRV